MNIKKEDITESHKEQYKTAWLYYDSLLRGVFNLTTTDDTNILVQSAQNQSGWYVLNYLTETYMSQSAGTKIEIFYNLIHTKFPNNQPPQGTVTQMLDGFMRLESKLTSGLSDEIKNLFIFNALSKNYEPLKAQIIAQDKELEEYTPNKLFSTVKSFYDTNIESKKGTVNTFTEIHANKHGKYPARGGGRGGRGRGRDSLAGRGGIFKNKKCTRCNKLGHWSDRCTATVCMTCKKAGRPFFHKQQECYYKEGNGTVNAMAKKSKSIAHHPLLKGFAANKRAGDALVKTILNTMQERLDAREREHRASEKGPTNSASE